MHHANLHERKLSSGLFPQFCTKKMSHKNGSRKFARRKKTIGMALANLFEEN